MTRPVFIVSLPRSGSTLLQKMLSVSTEVASSAEPWIMLPFWGMRHADAGRSIYFHHSAAHAINDFIGKIPEGEAVFERAVGRFAQEIYAAAARGKAVFLDKTPHYHLMLPLLRRALPEARFVVLLRNPLAVLASICETFNRGRFLWFEYWVDWLEGHRNLADAVRGGFANQIVVRYEDLVAHPDEVLPQVCACIGIEYSEAMIAEYRSAALPGRMGDPTGVHRYASVSTESVDKWRSFLATRYRRQVARDMVRRLDPDDLSALGYPLERLEAELDMLPVDSKLDWESRLHSLAGSVAQLIDFRYLQARWRARRGGRPYAYGYYRLPKDRLRRSDPR